MGKRINTLNTASSPANDDYLPIDGATNGTRKISADFVNNLITDVEVDGTSVVTSGVAEIDLSGKQDTLTAGSNIQIAQDGTISATDTTYTAGTNVQIDNGVISATDTTYTAGTGIDITNGVISSNVTPGSTVSVTQKTSTGTNIADITVDGVTTQLYAPNGGGGGSATLSGLTDVDLSSPTNGQILKYNSTTQKWENADESGGSQRTYLGQLIPRVSASDYKITASTSNSNYPAWGAFNGISPSGNLQDPSSNSCWLPEVNLTNQYIQYHFDAPRYFTKIGIVCFSSYSTDWVGDIKIEGSNDGSTWENILTSGTTYELTAEFHTIATVEINLDDTDLWEYIRVTFIDAMSVAYQPSCFIDEIYVYGGEEISGGSSAEEMTLDEYNALTTDQKNDGTIRFIPKSNIGYGLDIDFTNSTAYKESGMSNTTVNNNSVQIVWNTSDSNCGLTIYRTIKVDVTNYDFISYDFSSTNSYDSLHPGSENPVRDLGIGLCSSAPSAFTFAPSINWAIWNRYEVTDVGTTFTDERIDVSNLTGEYYLIIACVGWNATVSNIVIGTEGGNVSQIKYMSKTYADNQGAPAMKLTQAEYDALTREEKENGTIYFIDDIVDDSTQLIERVSAADTRITSSGHSRWGGEDWHAFDGITRSLSGIDNAWCALEDDATPWIQYHFDTPYYFTKLEMKVYCHYGSDGKTVRMNILASNDGTNWDNISMSGTAVSVNFPYQTLSTVEFDLNNGGNTYEYIRIQGTEPFEVAYGYGCDFDEIYVYGTDQGSPAKKIYYMGKCYTNTGGGGGGSTVVPNPTGTPTDTLDTVSIDGTIYEIQGSGGGNSWTDLTAVLEAGETSLTIIDSHITINGTYDFYTSKYGLNPLSIVIDDPSATILLQPLVAQESELSVTATASTNWSGFEPWKAFANSAVNSGWIASEGSGGYWLQAEFPYKVNVSSIDFKSLDSNRSHAISRVSYSNDGNTFTDATLTSSTMQSNIGHADVSMSETAKYIRLCFDYSLGTQTYPMVSQLELYGNIDSTSAGSMTLTFEEQTENINVKVRVS